MQLDQVVLKFHECNGCGPFEAESVVNGGQWAMQRSGLGRWSAILFAIFGGDTMPGGS